VDSRNKSSHDKSVGLRFTPAGIIRRLLFVCENDFIVPADFLKEALGSGLEDFLRQSIEMKSVDLAKLTDMLG
jgi:hypothetical protein